MAVKKKANQKRTIPPPPVRLTPDDLIEFRLRKNTLEWAHHLWAMVEESYIEWAKKLQSKYQLPPQFDVDIQTGVVKISNVKGGK